MRRGATRARVPTWTLALALCVPNATAHPASTETQGLVADFEGPGALQGWRFSTNAERAAAAGALSLGVGHRGQGAQLDCRLPCGPRATCDSSVAALYTPPSPLPRRHHPAISLWVRFPPEIEVFLIIRDSGGQALRFPLPAATLEHPRAGDWRFALVTLTTKAGRIKGALTEIGILVQARVRSPLAGSVSFDDIRLFESPARFHITAAAPVEPPPPESAELSPRLGVNIHLLQDNRSLDLAHAAGFRFVRMDLFWANVERNGRYRFFAYDRLLRALEARDMGVLWILDYGHPDHGGDRPHTESDLAAFARFAEVVAAHFKGRNVRYEIWNEPNNPEFWKPFPRAVEYAALLRAAVPAMLRADPSAKVSSGGLSRIDLDYLSGFVDSTLPANLSAIGIHPYRKAAPETVAPDLAILRQWTGAALHEPVEIWDTEWGYSSAESSKSAPPDGHKQAGRVRQAVFAIRELLTVWTVGFPLAVWYDLRDDGPDAANPEDNYGLLDAEGNEKPAMQAVRRLMQAVADRKYAGMISEPPAGLHAMRLDGSGDTIFIVWTDQPARRALMIDKRNLVSATGWSGSGINSKNRSNGLQVEIDDLSGPVYLRWRR